MAPYLCYLRVERRKKATQCIYSPLQDDSPYRDPPPYIVTRLRFFEICQ
jgi:hypothetical protein